MLLNGNKVNPRELKDKSCFIAENQIEGINTPIDMGTARTNIEKALAISGLPYSVSQIKELFHLSDGRFDRDFRYVSGEIWLMSMAIGFAMGKDLFCFPWLNKIEFYRASAAKPILMFLKEKGEIILISSSQKKELSKISDHRLILNPAKGRFLEK